MYYTLCLLYKPGCEVSPLAPSSNQLLLLSSSNIENVVLPLPFFEHFLCQVCTEWSISEILFWIQEGFSSDPYDNPMKYRYHFHYIIMHCTEYHVHNKCSTDATVLKWKFSKKLFLHTEIPWDKAQNNNSPL